MYTRLFACKENTDPPKLNFTFSENRNHVPSYSMFARTSSTYLNTVFAKAPCCVRIYVCDCNNQITNTGQLATVAEWLRLSLVTH